MHNPFQSYQTDPTWGAFAGMSSPFGTPFAGMQGNLNPALTMNPLTSALGGSCPVGAFSHLGQTGYAGIPSYGGIHPQQLQLAALLSQQQNPMSQFGQQTGSPFGQQMGSPFGQQTGSPFGQQMGSPYGQQTGSPFGQQTGSPFGNPLQQSPYALAALQNPLLLAALQQNPLLHSHQNPYQNPILSQQYGQQQFQNPYQQQFQNPYQQGIGAQFGHLAPQSWIGQGSPFGQINPLVAQQLGLRGIHGQGLNPWLGF